MAEVTLGSSAMTSYVTCMEPTRPHGIASENGIFSYHLLQLSRVIQPIFSNLAKLLIKPLVTYLCIYPKFLPTFLSFRRKNTVDFWYPTETSIKSFCVHKIVSSDMCTYNMYGLSDCMANITLLK